MSACVKFPDLAAIADRRLVDEVVQHLLNKLGRHHRPTFLHSMRVARLARDLAHHLRIDEENVNIIIRAAKLHDLGKIAVPVAILDKPAELNDDEWALMDRHCRIGADMLLQTEVLNAEAYLVLNHHRWYTANSPLAARFSRHRDAAVDLLGVCDAYDALTSDRPYRTPQHCRVALDYLEARARVQFNPEMVAALKTTQASLTASMSSRSRP